MLLLVVVQSQDVLMNGRSNFEKVSLNLKELRTKSKLYFDVRGGYRALNSPRNKILEHTELAEHSISR